VWTSVRPNGALLPTEPFRMAARTLPALVAWYDNGPAAEQGVMKSKASSSQYAKCFVRPRPPCS
jgi:hypothetical protein